jgi:hypothetical protein
VHGDEYLVDDLDVGVGGLDVAADDGGVVHRARSTGARNLGESTTIR